MVRTSPLFVALAMCPAFAVAGGNSWEVQVVDVSKSVVTVVPVESGAPWSGCAKATVRASFQPEPFGRRTWSKDIVSASTHREAMAKLEEAAKSGAVVRLGEMGSGLRKLEDPCTFESHGLALLEESDGRKQVYSFHDAI